MTIGPLSRMTPTEIGPLRVHALVDGVAPARKAHEMLLGAPDDLVADNIDWLAPDYIDADTERLRLAYQSFLVIAPEANILIDCAIGEDGDFASRPDWHHAKSNWLNHLGQAGLAPEDIDIVFLTHLHVDHTGWLTRLTPEGWSPTFPTARHLVTQVEHDFWMSRHEDFAFMDRSVPDSVEPVDAAGLFEFTTAGDEIVPGLEVVDLSGHSPGMVGLEYRQSDRIVAAFNADLMHHPLQMTVPEMSTRFCTDPECAAHVRRTKLAQYAKDDTLMFCGHFPGMSAGYAEPVKEGFRFRPLELTGSSS